MLGGKRLKSRQVVIRLAGATDPASLLGWPNQNYMLTSYQMAFWLKNVASTVDKDEFVCRSVFYKGKHRENRKELMERSVSGCIQLCGELPWSKPAL